MLTSNQVAGNALPIICNQENFILKANAYTLINALPNHYLIIKPAEKPSLEGGRPKNGMFIAFLLLYKSSVEDVSPSHWRIQAAILKCSSYKILIINSYFPTDPQTRKYDDTELIETLHCIRNLLVNVDHDAVL